MGTQHNPVVGAFDWESGELDSIPGFATDKLCDRVYSLCLIYFAPTAECTIFLAVCVQHHS